MISWVTHSTGNCNDTKNRQFAKIIYLLISRNRRTAPVVTIPTTNILKQQQRSRSAGKAEFKTHSRNNDDDRASVQGVTELDFHVDLECPRPKTGTLKCFVPLFYLTHTPSISCSITTTTEGGLQQRKMITACPSSSASS